MSKTARKGLIVILVGVAVALAGCFGPPPGSTVRGDGDGGAGDGASEPPQQSTAGDFTVIMKASKYDPATLTVPVGATVVWANEDPFGHTVTPTDKDHWGTDGSGDAADDWIPEGGSWSFTFTEEGTFEYYCLPHAFKSDDGSYKGMVGKVVVTQDGKSGDAFALTADTVVASPVAPEVKEPDADGIVRFTLETTEVVAQLSDGAAYEFWTFDGTVPGPMLRVREGDTVEITLKNAADSTMAHSIDLHAVTGPGGGAEATQVSPGESKSFRFKAVHPGVFVYHCATPHVPTHIANGMYGMIVVEPEGGYPPVDREYYVVQGETYTREPAGGTGLLSFSGDKLLSEDPEYFHFNGRVAALTGENALTANVGESVRIFFGVGGAVPSSFHVIGEVFDRVLMDGNGAATTHRQTILVPAAGSVIVEFDVEYPGTFVLVDHTLSRVFDRGAVGHLVVTGEEDPAIFHDGH